MIIIPKQLRRPEFRFVPVDNQKRPIEKGWTTNMNYTWDKLFKGPHKNISHYGVMTGVGKLLIIDIERGNQELANLIKEKLPNTFTVRTPSGGWHFYFIVKDFTEKIILIKTIKEDDEGNPIETKHYGELQWEGQQCLGPGSSYVSGDVKYEIENNIDIAETTKAEVIEVIVPYYTPKSQEPEFVSNKEGDQKWDISIIANELMKQGYVTDKSNDGKFKGRHPKHGSTSGQNFEIDVNKNNWFCFRHWHGGDAVSLVAILEGLVDCGELKKGYFAKHYDIYEKAIKIAFKKYGFKDGRKRKTAYKSKYDGEAIKVPILAETLHKGVLQVQEIVDYLKGIYTFIVVRDTTGRQPHIYVYDEGYYKLNGEDILVNEFKELMNQQQIPWKEHYKKEILGYIMTENIIDREDINPPQHLINLNNTVYNLNTGRCQAHSPDYYFLYKIPWDYKPRASCPKIMKFLRSTLKQKYITFVQELFGYCLSFDYSIHGIFYLYGTGGNGKGVLTDLLHALVGNQNMVSKSITSLASNRFATALLYGKLVNICGELGTDVLYNTDILKKLSAGDAIQAEFKNKDGFDFKNKAKIITSCNSIPSSNDYSYGWYRRQYIVPFLKKFSDTKDEIISLQSQLITQKEMEGLLKWALDGLKRLKQNSKFTYPADRQEKYIMYQQNADYFLRNYYAKAGPADILEFKAIYDDYMRWCDENDIPFVSTTAFGHALTNFLGAESPPPVIDDKTGKKTYYRHYIKKL